MINRQFLLRARLRDGIATTLSAVETCASPEIGPVKAAEADLAHVEFSQYQVISALAAAAGIGTREMLARLREDVDDLVASHPTSNGADAVAGALAVLEAIVEKRTADRKFLKAAVGQESLAGGATGLAVMAAREVAKMRGTTPGDVLDDLSERFERADPYDAA